MEGSLASNFQFWSNNDRVPKCDQKRPILYPQGEQVRSEKPERIIINTNHSYHHIHLPKSFLTDLMIQIQFKPIQQNKTSC